MLDEIQQKKFRLVPSNKEHNYKYLIYKEAFKNDNTIFHLVRRNKKTYRAVSKHNNDNEHLFFEDNLPIAITPNECIEEIIKSNLAGNAQEASIYVSDAENSILKDTIPRDGSKEERYKENQI